MPSPATRALVRLAVVVLCVGAAAAVWELLASQAPGSTYHAGVLPGPVGQLRGTACVIALSLLCAAWLKPWWSPTREPWWLVAIAGMGAALMLSAIAYGATRGLYGIQLDDPRPVSRQLAYFRGTGMALLGISLLEVARRLWFAPIRALGDTAYAHGEAGEGMPRSGGGSPSRRESGSPPVT